MLHGGAAVAARAVPAMRKTVAPALATQGVRSTGVLPVAAAPNPKSFVANPTSRTGRWESTRVRSNERARFSKRARPSNRTRFNSSRKHRSK